LTSHRSLAKAAKQLWKSEIAKTALILVLVIGCEYVFFFGLRYAFGTEYLPFHPVSSESMLPTLRVGDLIIVKGVESAAVSLNDIIVFHNPRNRNMLIVHRVVGIVKAGDTLYFETKGDNNPGRDNWDPYPGVPEHLVVGVVIGTIPYVGYVILALKEPLGMAIVALLTALVIVYEFVIPLTKRSKPESRAELEFKDSERRIAQRSSGQSRLAF